MRHVSTLQTIGWGVVMGVVIGVTDREAAADRPTLLTIFQAAQPVSAPAAQGVVRPGPAITGFGSANRAGAVQRPARLNRSFAPKSVGKKRSWEIVQKGSAADIGGNKSPGQGSAPSSMAFPEPSGTGPKRTPSNSTRVRAPEANPSSSTRVRAPSAPDPAPGTTPGTTPGSPIPSDSPGAPGPSGASLGEWLTAAGAIADMASGMMGQGNAGYGDAGYGDAGYGDAGGSYTNDPEYTDVYENSDPDNATGAVVCEVPANPSPAARINIAVVNPTANGVTLQFLLDGQPHTLEAGTRIDFTVTRPIEIKFDRGEQFGRGRYKLTEYLYTFRPTDHGWEIYRAPYVAPTQQ